MKTLYFDCAMGAAGDMLTAALLELHPCPRAFVAQLNSLGLPGVEFRAEQAVKCGITGTHMSVTVHGAEEDEHDHEHSHHHHHGHGLSDIDHILSHLAVPPQVRRDVMAVYGRIAEAESHAHGVPVEQVHFHEVGALDAIADVTAVCLLIYELAPERILASPIHVGSGQVKCAHGILPVPAPATAWLLRGVPTYGGEVRGELCTPTGAALLTHFVEKFGPQPVMSMENIGYGCGKKDFPQANCVRALLGESEQPTEEILELKCNLDDMTPEAVGFCMGELLAAGALDAFTTPIGMKKNRPGVLLTCLCRREQREDMIGLLFRHTTTLGVRETVCARHTLSRTLETRQTEFGSVRVKCVTGWGVRREKAEYEDLAKIAREQGLSLAQAATLVKQEGR